MNSYVQDKSSARWNQKQQESQCLKVQRFEKTEAAFFCHVFNVCFLCLTSLRHQNREQGLVVSKCVLEAK